MWQKYSGSRSGQSVDNLVCGETRSYVRAIEAAEWFPACFLTRRIIAFFGGLGPSSPVHGCTTSVQQDRLHASADADTTKGLASGAISGTGTGVGMAKEDARTAQLRPAEATRALAEPLPSRLENGEEPAGNMATSRPRLFLWQRADGRGPPKRVVTFHDGSGRDGESKSSGVAASAADKGREESKRSEIVPEVLDREERASGEAGRRSGQLSRADFIQLSYAMKNVPARGNTGGVGSSEGVMCHGAWRGQVRLRRTVLAAEVFASIAARCR